MPKFARRIPGHARTTTFKTLLHVACYYGHANIVESFLTEFRANFDLDARDIYNDTPLRTAVVSRTNSVKIVSLLKHGAIRKGPIVEGSKTMRLAVASQRLEMVQLLMQHMKKVYSSHQILMMMTRTGWSILEVAIGADILPILEFLLREIDAMLADKELRYRFGYLLGKGALQAAASAGSSSSLRLITKSRVPIYIRDTQERTPLHYARKACVVECLVNADPSLLSARDIYGITPLLEAFRENVVEVWRALSRLGANTRDGTTDGRTGLHLLMSRSYLYEDCSVTLEFLIEEELVEWKDDNGNRALHLLDVPYTFNCTSWCKCIDRLLRAGATLLATNNAGRTVAENLFNFLQKGREKEMLSRSGYHPLLHRVIIYFMEELRQEETRQLLDHEQRNYLRFLCHRFRSLTRFDDKQAERILRRGMEAGDKTLLRYLQKSARVWLANEQVFEHEGSFGGQRYIGHVPVAWTKPSKLRPPH